MKILQVVGEESFLQSCAVLRLNTPQIAALRSILEQWDESKLIKDFTARQQKTAEAVLTLTKTLTGEERSHHIDASQGALSVSNAEPLETVAEARWFKPIPSAFYFVLFHSFEVMPAWRRISERRCLEISPS